MPNRNYEKGRRFEYVEKKRLENLGYIVLRTSGSHGFADLVAVKPGEVRFIQCKAQPATKADVKKIQKYAYLSDERANITIELSENI